MIDPGLSTVSSLMIEFAMHHLRLHCVPLKAMRIGAATKALLLLTMRYSLKKLLQR
jgi:hypothetical protein